MVSDILCCALTTENLCVTDLNLVQTGNIQNCCLSKRCLWIPMKEDFETKCPKKMVAALLWHCFWFKAVLSSGVQPCVYVLGVSLNFFLKHCIALYSVADFDQENFLFSDFEYC